MVPPRWFAAGIPASGEAMFAEKGFDAVPAREIMNRADARLGFSCYFGSKEALFEAVIARRVDVLNARRLNRLRALVGADDSSVERVVEG